jgi:hypothetical protein
MGKKLEIDFETADKITLDNLKDAYKYLNKSTKKHLKDPQNNWMHPEDLQNNLTVYLPAFKLLIEYYGGTV